MQFHEWVPGIYPDEYYCLKCQKGGDEVESRACEFHDSIFPRVRKKPVSVLTHVIRSITSAARGR